MSARSTLASLGALVIALPLLAQDPVTGSWKAELTPTGGGVRRVTMELRFDGRSVAGTVTGMPEPGDVKNGTYDPVKKSLTLPMGPTDGTAALLTLTGTLVNGVATGTAIGTGGTEGTFILTRDGQSAPQGSATDAAAAVRAGCGEVSGWVTKAAELIPADKYAYKPTTSVRTVGQMIGHIADSYGYYCGRAAKGRGVEWSDTIEKGKTDKATLAPKLKQAVDACNAVYGTGTGDIGQLMANVAHTNLHYGNLITYIRMLGMTPPSS